jgi:transposase
MDREQVRAQLRDLPADVLIELILSLQARVAEFEALQVRVAQLEAELASAHQPAKTPANSSVPPAQARKANRAERRGRKQGARRGHVGSSRRRQTPDQVLQVRPTACGGCGAELSRRDQRRVGKSQVIELPPVRPVVIEVWRYAAVCPACQHRTVAEAPAGLEPHRVFGPRLEAQIGYLHERHHLSYERLVEVGRELYDLHLSQGAVVNILARLADRARPTYEAIGAAVRGSPVLGSDETGARVKGQNRCHWVFQTDQASYHQLATTKGAAVIDEFLAGAEPEVWISDLAPAQLGAPAAAHQICLAHQLRDLQYAIDADAQIGVRWAVALQRVFRRGIHLHHERGQLTPESFLRRRTLIEHAAERLIFRDWAGDGAAGNLQRRYAKHWSDLFVFLDRDDVEPTNNASERDLRNSVIHRKVTGGYRSDWGAQASMVLISILTTARKRGQSYFAALCAVAGPSPLQPAGMGS